MTQINVSYNGDKATLSTTCPICGRKNKDLVVDAKNYEAYKNGMHVQFAFPDLSSEDREMLVSGICPECWSGMFSEDEDDEDDE